MFALKNASERHNEIYELCWRYFFEHENPTLAIKNAEQFTDGYDAFGLTDLEVKALRDAILTQYNPTPAEIAELGKIFFATGKYEFGTLAIMLIKKHRPRMDRDVYLGVLEWLDKGVENWAHADLIATKITPVFLELGIASLDDFESWRNSSSKWTRRVAALTMLYLRDKASPERLLEFIEPMMRDNDRNAQQGIGTFLRELWRLHSKEVEEFLYTHRDNAAPLIVQYATDKMHKDKKKRFHRSMPDRNRPKQNNNRNQNNPNNRNPNHRNAGTRNPNPNPNSRQFPRTNDNANPPRGKQRNQPQRSNFAQNIVKPNNRNKNRFRPNAIVPEPEEFPEDNLPDWDDFDKNSNR